MTIPRMADGREIALRSTDGSAGSPGSVVGDSVVSRGSREKRET